MASRKSLVLVTVDCLRADHCGFMGYRRPTTPFLDGLSGESFVFPKAIVAGVPTPYSLPAILASRYPLNMGREVLGLGVEETCLASVLKSNGYATAFFGAANPYLQASIADQNRRGNEAIQSSMSAAGRYGSGQYQDVMARAQAEVADPLLMQDYEARQARALQANQGLGQTFGQQLGVYQQGVGQAMQGLAGIGGLAQAQYIPGPAQMAAGQ